MADRKILFRNGSRSDELSPGADRARVGGLVSSATLDLGSASGSPITIGVGGSTKVTITADGRLDTSASAAAAAIRVGALAGDPSALADGDIWYNSSTQKFRGRQGGTTLDLIGAGGGGGGGWTDTGAVVILDTASDTVAIGIGVMLAAEKVRIAGSLLVDQVGQIYVGPLTGVSGNRVVYKTSGADEAAHAIASSLSTCETYLGVSANGASVGQAFRVNTSGTVTVEPDSAISIAPGDKIFLSSTSAGRVTNVEPTASGQVKLYLGTAKTATTSPGSIFTMAWLPRTPTLIP